MPILADSIPLTEQENPRTQQISSLSTADIVRLMNDEDAGVAKAVAEVLGDVTSAVDQIVKRMQRGGRLIYVGTGTSGRLGVLDASECPPTFGTPPDLVQAVIAGGPAALTSAIEGAEDNRDAGCAEINARAVTYLDAVVGLSASGT